MRITDGYARILPVPYTIHFSEEARAHLRQLSARERTIVINRVEAALSDKPTREARNLKALRPNPLAKYELRIADLRVFFEVKMKTLELSRTSPSVRRAARLARSGVLVLTENGKPAFAIAGVKDQLALEALTLGRNTKFMAYLDEVSRRAKRKRTYSLKEMRDEFGLPARRRNGRRKR